MNTLDPRSPRRALSVARRPRHAMSRLVAVTAVAAMAGGMGLALAPAATAAPVTNPASYVKPFIGSKDDGNTYPGATVPFGMVQLSPDTGHNVGYNYDNNVVRGFSQVHLSGVGCGLGGFVPITPSTEIPTNTDYADGGYSRSFKRDSNNQKVEEASPGYYTATLTSGAGNDIKAELTATTHTGVQRYDFSGATQSGAGANVLINAGQALSSVRSSKVSIDVANKTVRTETVLHGFCQDTPDFTIYSTTKFNTAFAGYGTWVENTKAANSTTAAATNRTGAYLSFNQGAVVEAQTAISYASAAGADANLTAEAGTFDATRTGATATWNTQLGKVSVTQGVTNAASAAERNTQLRVFYSALYRSFLAPNVGNDVNGNYRGWDGNVHNISESGVTAYYQNFSLWDTYRTQQQWLYLVEPKRSEDMAKSLVLQSEQYGWAPRWGYGPVETNVMTGDPITPFLVSAWDQGLLTGSWAERAYTVLKNNADNTPPASSYANGRAGNSNYIANGYVPQDSSTKSKPGDYDLDHGGSATLEYALSDATLSTMASGLGHTADATRYAKRGQNFRSLWDPVNKTFRTRDANGLYVAETDSAQIGGFHEGTAAQYEWMVQQDMPSLIELMGGTNATNARLDEFFAYSKIDLANNPGKVALNSADSKTDGWVNGTYSYYGYKTYNPNNEPDLHAPYTYLWTGQPWKTTDVVREALTLFTDAPNGVTGNDDLGTMAAWQVMSSIGIYPIVPGKDVWGLTTPIFDQVDIKLDTNYFAKDTLSITANGVSMSNRYTEAVTAGGTSINKGYLTGDQLTGAGTLAFTAGTTPSTTWATGADAAPGAIAPVDSTPSRVYAGVSPSQVTISAGSTGTATVGIMAQGEGTRTGTVTVANNAVGIKVSGASNWSASANGGTAAVSQTVSIEVPASTAHGSYPVTIKAKDNDGQEYTVGITIIVPVSSWLNGSFNNKAIGDRSAGNGSASFNGNEFFIRDLMASSGMAAGVSYSLPTDSTLKYVLQDAGVGSSATTYDNIEARGQTTDVQAGMTGATKIAFVGAAHNDSQINQTVTLTYTDNTTKSLSVTLTDWCSPNGADTNVRAGKAGQRWSGGVQDIGCGLWATQSYTLDAGKSVKSITWPNADKFHVFAIATDGTPAAVTASAKPTITGSAVSGSTVTATAPTWTPSDATTTYQWSVDGQNVAGATSATYVVKSADVGKTLQVAVSGTKSGYTSGSAISEPVSVVAQPMTTTTAPAITGTARVGDTLSTTAGTYSASDVAVAYQWLADGADIAGATSNTLALTAALQGKQISVRVTATKAGYVSAVNTAGPTAAVVEAPALPVSVVKAPVIAGTAQVGATLTASTGTYNPAGTTVAYQWLRNNKPIAGATKNTYQATPTDRGTVLSVRVTATKTGYTTAVTTTKTAQVKSGVIKVTKKPVIAKATKNAKVGKKLKVTKGSYSITGVKVTYQWYAGSKKIAKATKPTYKVTKSNRGKKLKVKVTATKTGYTTVTTTTKALKIRR